MDRGINWWRTPPESPKYNPNENLWSVVKTIVAGKTLLPHFILALEHFSCKGSTTWEVFMMEVKPSSSQYTRRTTELLTEWTYSIFLNCSPEKCGYVASLGAKFFGLMLQCLHA